MPYKVNYKSKTMLVPLACEHEVKIIIANYRNEQTKLRQKRRAIEKKAERMEYIERKKSELIAEEHLIKGGK